MKILVGEFITESNANIPQKCEISNYKMLFGDDCIQALHVADVFEQAGFELIPSVVADAGAAGVIKKDTFDYIESCFVRTVKEHIHEIDGMFLMLHGASEVEGIEFLRPAKEGDVLTAVGQEQSLSGRHGIYDIRVSDQNGQTIALFRGKSTQIAGHVVPA